MFDYISRVGVVQQLDKVVFLHYRAVLTGVKWASGWTVVESLCMIASTACFDIRAVGCSPGNWAGVVMNRYIHLGAIVQSKM